MMTKIKELLYSLGITANYTGFFHTYYAVQLAIDDPQRLLLVTKLLYPEVARHYNVKLSAVERNIRTAITVAWSNNPEQLIQFARCPLTHKPTAAQFISILASVCTST